MVSTCKPLSYNYNDIYIRGQNGGNKAFFRPKWFRFLTEILFHSSTFYLQWRHGLTQQNEKLQSFQVRLRK